MRTSPSLIMCWQASPSVMRSPMLRLPPAPRPPVPPSRLRPLPRTMRMTTTGANTCKRCA
nr:MAG TPA: hypothetical protein [Caudoviricetes sp.]